MPATTLNLRPRCTAKVNNDGWGMRQCTRRASVIEDDAPRCGTHTKAAAARREAASAASYAKHNKRYTYEAIGRMFHGDTHLAERALARINDMPYEVFAKHGLIPLACVAYPEDAAAMVSNLGHGARVIFKNNLVWLEGGEEIPAGESYDQAAAIITSRAINL